MLCVFSPLSIHACRQSQQAKQKLFIKTENIECVFAAPVYPLQPISQGKTSKKTCSFFNDQVQAKEGPAFLKAIAAVIKEKNEKSGGGAAESMLDNQQQRQQQQARVSYKDAGVDIDAGNVLVERIKPACKSTKRPGCDSDLGGFGGLFDLSAAGYSDGKDTILVGATDGVGTKLKVIFFFSKCVVLLLQQ